ncbi:hypothetical protein H4R18_004246 [Coemansia javaensis]|uniref:Uncharacterized protein n=1 Tax=Coemansia javaensis TaxID=2761396 RepID=A0A9W8H675_9FUNG|nr:hypothetical protein H4R18_004246 [Coemansia javaensis]
MVVVDGARWRALHRSLLRAAPGAASGRRRDTSAIIRKIRQGFDEGRRAALSDAELAAVYRRGCNTLGFLKLARELGSVERAVVASILQMEARREATDEKPPAFKRRLQGLQAQEYAEAHVGVDRAVASIEQELDIILPRYTSRRSLEWIPRLRSLYGG